MPTPTYTNIASITLASAVSSVSLSIPSGYKDIIIISQIGSNLGSTDYVKAYINGDTTSGNYAGIWARGYSTSSVGSSTFSSSLFDTGIAIDGTGTASNLIMNIMDYTATDKHKNILSRLNNVSDATWMITSKYASTSAVSSVLFNLYSGSIRAGSTFNVYGIVG